MHSHDGRTFGEFSFILFSNSIYILKIVNLGVKLAIKNKTIRLNTTILLYLLYKSIQDVIY
jgi:hypothetical protein